MTPRDFHTLAEELIEGDGEAHWRSAVSRAYYAAFHVARLLLQSCGFRVPPSEEAHNYISHRLNNSGREAVNEAGSALDVLRRFRNEADYDLWRRLSRRDADDLVEDARDIIEALEAVEADAALKSAVTQAMRDSERDVLKDVTWSG